MNTEQREKAFIWEACYNLSTCSKVTHEEWPDLYPLSNHLNLRATVLTASDSALEAIEAIEIKHGKGEGLIQVEIEIHTLRFIGSSEVYKAKP